MPRFEPFAGVRYERRHDLASVTAPPYDVIDPAERAALAASDPCNVVHIDLPTGDDPYAAAARTFSSWLEARDLVTDEPCLYPYRMSFGGHHTFGVIGALGLEADSTSDVLPHEQTTPKAKSDRLDLLRATHANLSPIWALSLSPGLTKLIDLTAATSIGSWRDPDGVEHELWRLPAGGVSAAVCDAIASVPLVVADGHHRYETCLTFAAERPDLRGARATMCYVVELVDEEITVQAIHRLARGVSADAVRHALDARYEPGEGGITLVLPDEQVALRPRLDEPPLATAYLADALAPLPSLELVYQHGAENIVGAVKRGEAAAGFLLEPVTVDEIAATARAREKMPPKTTFFWPKPRTGTVFRRLD